MFGLPVDFARLNFHVLHNLQHGVLDRRFLQNLPCFTCGSSLVPIESAGIRKVFLEVDRVLNSRSDLRCLQHSPRVRSGVVCE